MDGVQGNETCDGNLYYMSGPSRGPADGSCEHCRGDAINATTTSAKEEPARSVPGLGVFAVFAAFAIAVVGVAGLRRE
jgi:hypothetical protein